MGSRAVDLPAARGKIKSAKFTRNFALPELVTHPAAERSLRPER